MTHPTIPGAYVSALVVLVLQLSMSFAQYSLKLVNNFQNHDSSTSAHLQMPDPEQLSLEVVSVTGDMKDKETSQHARLVMNDTNTILDGCKHQ